MSLEYSCTLVLRDVSYIYVLNQLNWTFVNKVGVSNGHNHTFRTFCILIIVDKINRQLHVPCCEGVLEGEDPR